MKKISFWMFLPVALLFIIPCAAQTDAPKLPMQYAATAVGQAGSVAGKTFGLNIYVEGITSDGDTSELVSVLKAKGQDGLLSAFGNMKDIGRLSPTGSVGTGVRFVRVHPAKDGGLKIIMATDRPISFGELYNGTRSRDYPFSITVLNLGKDGKGSGLLCTLCKVKFNKKGDLEIENYGQKPFRLTNVYREK